MAKVVLIELESAADEQIRRALAIERHRVEQHRHPVTALELLDADIVFAGGEPVQYMSLLKRLREVSPTLPFVVVTRMPETSAWLDALEAGATDYCAAPIERRHLGWLMESALPRPADCGNDRRARDPAAVRPLSRNPAVSGRSACNAAAGGADVQKNP